MPQRQTVEVDGHQLTVTNLDKVLWPTTGHTKAHLVRHALTMAPHLVPHLVGRPASLHRFPDGVDGEGFWEKRVPDHAPDWLTTVEAGDASESRVQPVLDSAAALVWAANLGAIELHAPLALAPALTRPRWVVFDLDPGEGADLATCARVALLVRQVLDRLDLRAWVKLSGSKGLHLLVPAVTDVDGEPLDFPTTRTFVHTVATLLQRAHPDLVVVGMSLEARKGKVLVDWRQNEHPRTMVAPWSVRARPRPTVSAPLPWALVEDLAAEEAATLEVLVDDAPAWAVDHGAALDGLVDVQQRLPRLATPGS